MFRLLTYSLFSGSYFDTIINGKAKVTYTAKGKLRDNTIVFDDNYSGFFTEKETGAVGTIKSDNAITIAKLND